MRWGNEDVGGGLVLKVERMGTGMAWGERTGKG